MTQPRRQSARSALHRMPNEVPVPSRLRVVATLWALLGISRAVVQFTFGASRWTPLQVIVTAVGGAMFWIPVNLGVLWVGRSRSARQSRLQLAALVLAGLAGVLAAQPLWLRALSAAVGMPSPPYLSTFSYCLDSNVLLFAACIAMSWAERALGDAADATVSALELESSVAETQLHVTTMQLQPHFLFNALHVISEKVGENPTLGRLLARQLRALLFESFRHASRRVVSVQQELDFIRAYLNIQLARFESRLAVTFDIDPGALDASVPHLFMQPLVENAIRHGIGKRLEGGVVTIAIRRFGDSLAIDISDNGVGRCGRARTGSAGGMGLTITRKRLSLIYGDTFEFELEDRRGGGTIAHARFPVHPPRQMRVREGLADLATAIRTQEKMGLRRRALPLGGVLIGAWVSLTALWTGTELLGDRQLRIDVSVRSLVIRFSTIALTWTVVTMFSTIAARRMLRATASRAMTTLRHAATACAATGAQIGLTVAVLSIVSPPTVQVVLRWSPNWIIWDFMSYAAVVIVVRALALAADCQTRRLQVTMLRGEVAMHRARLRQLQLQPEVMLSALDELDAPIDAAPAERVDETIARLGDLLRAIIEGGSRSNWRVSEELEAVRAYTDICNACWHRVELIENTTETGLRAEVPAGILASLVAALCGGAAGNALSCRIEVVCRISTTLEGDCVEILVGAHSDDIECRLGALRETVAQLRALLALRSPARGSLSMTVINGTTISVELRLRNSAGANRGSQIKTIDEGAAA